MGKTRLVALERTELIVLSHFQSRNSTQDAHISNHNFVITYSSWVCYKQPMPTKIHRPVGRPPIADEALKQISVRFTNEEIEYADKIAKRQGISRNEAIRYLYNLGRDA